MVGINLQEHASEIKASLQTSKMYLMARVKMFLPTSFMVSQSAFGSTFNPKMNPLSIKKPSTCAILKVRAPKSTEPVYSE